MTRQTCARIAIATWLLGLAVTTSIRARVWRSDQALWSDAVAKAPDKPRPVLNDGRAHELAGDVTYAETAYRRALSLSFDERRSAYVRRFTRAAAETNLAHLRMNRGEWASAMRILDDTIRDWPAWPYGHYNRGSILWIYGACDAAWTEFAIAHQGDPSLPPPKGTCAPRSSTP